MTRIIRWIPNLITLTGLFFGFVGILHALNVSYYHPLKTFHQADLVFAAWMVIVSAVLDFLDGLAARLLNAKSELGKQLDSLVDVVCFGVLPAVILHVLLLEAPNPGDLYNVVIGRLPVVSLASFVFLAAAVVRLGRFNLLSTTAHHFRGLPVPFAAFIVASIPIVTAHQDLIVIQGKSIYFHEYLFRPGVLIGLTLVLAVLMLSRMPLLSLKWDFSVRRRPPALIGVFLLLAAVLIGLLGYLGLWALIILYFAYSLLLSKQVKGL